MYKKRKRKPVKSRYTVQNICLAFSTHIFHLNSEAKHENLIYEIQILHEVTQYFLVYYDHSIIVINEENITAIPTIIFRVQRAYIMRRIEVHVYKGTWYIGIMDVEP